MREALSRLVSDGLAVAHDQKGFTVAPASVADLLDLTRLRCDFEAIALRRSVAEGDAGWEAGVLAAAHRLRRTPRAVDGSPHPDWSARHEASHRSLLDGAGSPRLLAFSSWIYQQLERYRLIAWSVDRERDLDAEHERLARAALDRDADALVGSAREHYERTASLIAAALERDRDAAAPRERN